MKTIFFNVLLVAFSFQLAGVPVRATEDMSAEIIAAQIRKQGFACDKPLSAEMDEKLSKPHMAAWTLQCDNAAYKVQLIPKMAAKAERVK